MLFVAEYSDGCPIEKQLGLVCTDTHLLMLGALKSHTDQSGASDSDVNDVADDVSGNEEDVNSTKDSSGGSKRQLKIFLRIKKRYDTLTTTKKAAFLLCARGGTLDLFQVRWYMTRCKYEVTM